MIKESDGDSFESMRSMEQNLTFESAKKAFSRYGVPFSKAKYRVLGMTLSTDGLYSNLAEILSDQCCHTTKVAVFADAANTEFRDSKEFGGSVFEQLDSVFLTLRFATKYRHLSKGLNESKSRIIRKKRCERHF